jgi:hypothetical protein
LFGAETSGAADAPFPWREIRAFQHASKLIVSQEEEEFPLPIFRIANRTGKMGHAPRQYIQNRIKHLAKNTRPKGLDKLQRLAGV